MWFNLGRVKGFLVFLAILLASKNLTFGQSTTIGREFFLGFMENNRTTTPVLRLDQASIIISAEEDATGVIQYESNSIPFSVKAGDQFVYAFPEDGLDMIHRTSRRIENKGIYIMSSGNISVHAFNFRARSADGTVILPLPSLGKDYYVTAHHENFNPGVDPGSNVNYESTLLVVAVEDNTQVEISLSAQSNDPIPIPPGSTISVELSKGESYQVKAVGDLTGSRVRVVNSTGDDCKNVAVFGGNKMTSVAQECDGSTGDHLFQQTYPIFSWGKEYVHIPFAGRTSGEMVKVLAAENNTRVFVNGQQRAVINAGRHVSFSFGREELANITADKPIAVTTFAKSYFCNIQSGQNASNGDPTMITLSPNNQLIKSTVFSAVQVVGIVNHFVNILTKTESKDKTILDGQNIGASFQPVPGNAAYSYARVEVSEGSHSLSNEDGLIGYVYGSGFIESYGYSAGASINNLNFETEVAYDFDVVGDKVACLGEQASWTVNPRDSKFVIFEWKFENEEDIKEGKTVEHLFDEPGVYKIKISAMTGDRSCDEMEEAEFEVTVVESKGSLEGPENVCPNIDEVTYFFENPENSSSVLWEVVGGQILEEDAYSVKVLWGDFDPEAKVIATPLTEEGCQGIAQEIAVFINDSIIPRKPKGIAEICYDEGVSQFYSVADLIPGRVYQWFIEGGEILSQSDAYEIEVLWPGPGSTGQIWYEEYSGANASCGGESERLVVNVNTPLQAEVADFTELVCAGANAGSIEMRTSGGSGNYEFIWTHDNNLKGPKAENLQPGVYSVIVKDAGGCELFFENIEISEAPALQLSGEMNIEPARCFDSEDGSLSFEVLGGVAPYTVLGESVLVVGSSIQVFNLAKGNYAIEVIDAGGCVLPLEFEVGAPETMETEFILENVACPGSISGSILAISKGGVGPYAYFWEFDGSVGPRLSQLGPGEYTLRVTDSNDCEQSFTGSVTEDAPQLRMPTGFDTQKESIFEGVSNCEVAFTLMIYSKWGELVYVGNEGWDGTIKGQEAPMGVYSYMIEYSYTIDGTARTEKKAGVFTLIR
ncbi:gliding motility-associated C-terminal domain-containing protein [Arthrospiribacter ruber]|uniref:PKD domain containing protein n=1 Tax=Arthrospiribacter ruber TaxID=2487934 RepID=A0A951IUT2_9BACT|nr:gliding motility-associated C-terminal domain-containing protein [Arthrospiribacter ruber]MBW3466754.1 PKD domain containing protein [Arthrospiribacter ruber]